MATDDRYAKVALLARRKLEEWDAMDDFDSKFEMVEMEDFSDLSSLNEQLAGYTHFFCALGSRVG